MDLADQMDLRQLIDGRQGCTPEPDEISQGSSQLSAQRTAPWPLRIRTDSHYGGVSLLTRPEGGTRRCGAQDWPSKGSSVMQKEGQHLGDEGQAAEGTWLGKVTGAQSTWWQVLSLPGSSVFGCGKWQAL